MGLSKIVHESKELSRVAEVSINQKTLITPTYFPAVSSHGIKYPPCSLVHLLTTYSYPRLLISTYDLNFLDKEEKEQLLREISEYQKRGSFVFLDSGVYESYWKANSEWTYDSYKTSISKMKFDFYSSFDILPSPKNRAGQFERKTFESILASRSLSNKPGFVPILHGSNPDQLVSLLSRFVNMHPDLCEMIAVAERDCGKDIVEKARTIRKIRQVLDASDCRRILHILGCGNPISLVLFSYYGANMFDSLDWIEHVVDRKRLAFNEFSQLELMNCGCSICLGKQRDYIEQVLLHNLLFYQDFMLQIQSLVQENRILDFILEYVNEGILRKIDY